MQKDLLKSRLSKLPPLPALDAEGHELPEDGATAGQEEMSKMTRPNYPEELEDEEDEERDAFPASLPTSGASPSSSRPPRLLPSMSRTKDYSPLTAEGYFSSALEVDVPSSSNISTFRVYYTPPPPSASNDELDANLDSRSNSSGVTPPSPGSVFVCVHGAGYSGLSFACLAKDLIGKTKHRSVGVLSYDARGHGKTKADPKDMSLQVLVEDLVALLKTMYPEKSEAPNLILVGHSMGGAVVSTACNRIQAEVAAVIGVVVIDVVEGTAIDALSSMGSIIANQPQGFPSIERAIEWHVRTKTLNNLASARISVPPLVRIDPDATATSGERYRWTADLASTEPFWRGWFTGLSTKFLTCRTAKLLLLAGAETLDKELMIGQMQGKYQLQVIAQSGHCVQEDHPEKTADLLISFWERNDRTDVLKGVKKIGQV